MLKHHDFKDIEGLQEYVELKKKFDRKVYDFQFLFALAIGATVLFTAAFISIRILNLGLIFSILTTLLITAGIFVFFIICTVVVEKFFDIDIVSFIESGFKDKIFMPKELKSLYSKYETIRTDILETFRKLTSSETSLLAYGKDFESVYQYFKKFGFINPYKKQVDFLINSYPLIEMNNHSFLKTEKNDDLGKNQNHSKLNIKIEEDIKAESYVNIARNKVYLSNQSDSASIISSKRKDIEEEVTFHKTDLVSYGSTKSSNPKADTSKLGEVLVVEKNSEETLIPKLEKNLQDRLKEINVTKTTNIKYKFKKDKS